MIPKFRGYSVKSAAVDQYPSPMAEGREVGPEWAGWLAFASAPETVEAQRLGALSLVHGECGVRLTTDHQLLSRKWRELVSARGFSRRSMRSLSLPAALVR